MPNHCAWCGDPGDENGSHTICAAHTTALLAQLAAAKKAAQAASKITESDPRSAPSQEPSSPSQT